MDKVVIFDWGGIVESHENDLQELKEAEIRLIKRFNNTLSEQEILDKWIDETAEGILIGASNKQEHIKDWVNCLQRNMNINVPFDEFKEAYEEEFMLVNYYKDVVEFAHSLKSRCKIGILSNLSSFDKKRIDYQYNLSEFDYVYLSFEIGIKKPDKRIYEYVLNDLKIEPQNILFIDDDYNNIQSAKECGWNTCQAVGTQLDKIKESVNNFLEEKEKQ